MAVWKATKTLAAIDAAICADGGNSYRRNLGQVLPHLSDAYRSDEDDRRTHLGASVIGSDCERAVFFGFRWASKVRVRGKKGEDPQVAESRMRRLWNRGHLEEGRFIALLLTAGISVYQQDQSGKQFRITNLGGHFSGSGDGIAVGCPDLPVGVPCLLEMKTHSSDSFKKLVEDGVKVSKFQHYVQMNQYGNGFGLLYALYLAVNKDTDEIYAEIVQIDSANAQAFLDLAKRIVFAHQLPARIRGGNPGYHVCKYMCDHTDVCYSTVEVERNCRTCEYVQFNPNGTVECISLNQRVKADENGWEDPIILDKNSQLQGCSNYRKGDMFK